MLLILDFGSQFTQLISRRLRELGHYSEIHPYHLSMEEIHKKNPKAIILSGGPASVFEESSPSLDVRKLTDSFPILGICYGMQLLAHQLGGRVKASSIREYGYHQVRWEKALSKIPLHQKVWMSHGDVVDEVPEAFEILARSETGLISAMRGPRAWAVQFHPEVSHTEMGSEILRSFVEDFCGLKPKWNSPSIFEGIEKKVRQMLGPSDQVLCALSGGVDSSVVATLLTRILGRDRVHCVFVDTGLLRADEAEAVLQAYTEQGLDVKKIQAGAIFLSQLRGVTDPETKRKIIGRLFVEIFEKEAPRSCQWLAQGTLYPDVIESVSPLGGPSHTIKTHHNVGGLPEKMQMKVLEPVRELFKDEVRELGRFLGLPSKLVDRHPFPGPGLAIRIIGEVTAEKVQLLQKVDEVFLEFLRSRKLYHKIWQAFAVLLPVQTVGVQGDGRTYESLVALRAVTSSDGMTADWYPFDFEDLREISKAITNRVRGVSRVVYDVTSKPPATIEWE